jgi:NAD(P)-dependent dehydrogenase (short-subunit alcohol dehydrogenase family)
MTSNPVALITGASRGIGRGIALELAKVGHDLVVNFAGNADAARATAADCVAAAQAAGKPIRAEICQGDVGKAADRERLIAFTRVQFGRLDLLVNNAGITSIGRRDVLEAREEDFDALMAINLKGPYFLSQLAANWMIDQASSRRGQEADLSQLSTLNSQPGTPPPHLGGYRPKIIIISSISGYAVSTNRGDYCMAKAALGMMTKLYATRLADHGINVYEVCPGVIASDMTAPVKEKYDKLFADGLAPLRRWGTPEDVGRAVTALALDYLPYSTGETLNVDGGFHVRRL